MSDKSKERKLLNKFGFSDEQIEAYGKESDRLLAKTPISLQLELYNISIKSVITDQEKQRLTEIREQISPNINDFFPTKTL